MTIRPRQDRVIVKRITAEEAPPSGIIIPDVAKEKPIEGEVLAVGNGDHHIDPPGGRAGRESAGRREHGRSGRHRPDGAGGFHALARNLVQRRAAVWPLELAAARRVGGEHGAHEAPLHIHGQGNRGRRGGRGLLSRRAHRLLAGRTRGATATVERTASLKIERYQITGGWRPNVSVNYGDPAAYTRMGESAGKLQTHEQA